MWYTFDKIRTYNAFYNFVVSNRGGGKTYGALKLGIRDFLKKGEQFIYLRRSEAELKMCKNNLFDAIIYNNEFPDIEIKQKGNIYYINGLPACYMFAVSTAYKMKSIAFPKVTKIFYDEFIPLNGVYLRDEVLYMNELVNTVDRYQNKTKVFFLGNSISYVNPYFSYYGITIDNNKEFYQSKNKMAVCQLFVDEDYQERAKNSNFGKLNAGTEYESYAINNEALMDNNAFICKRPTNTKLFFIFSFKIEGYKEIGLWKAEGQDLLYMDYKYNPDSHNRYSITKEGHKPQYVHIDKLKRSRLLDNVKMAYNIGDLYFYDLDVKNAYLLLLKYI